jgi:hypothetical protein
MVAQPGGAHAKLIGERAQVPASMEVLVNRRALAVAVDRAHGQLGHRLGDLYGRAVLDLLRYRLAASETTQLGLCIYLPVEPQAPPSWTEAQVVRYLEDTYRELEALLDLGPFHRLLPAHVRRRAVVEQFNVPRFLEAIAALRPLVAPDALADDLAELLL